MSIDILFMGKTILFEREIESGLKTRFGNDFWMKNCILYNCDNGLKRYPLKDINMDDFKEEVDLLIAITDITAKQESYGYLEKKWGSCPREKRYIISINNKKTIKNKGIELSDYAFSIKEYNDIEDAVQGLFEIINTVKKTDLEDEDNETKNKNEQCVDFLSELDMNTENIETSNGLDNEINLEIQKANDELQEKDFEKNNDQNEIIDVNSKAEDIKQEEEDERNKEKGNEYSSGEVKSYEGNKEKKDEIIVKETLDEKKKRILEELEQAKKEQIQNVEKTSEEAKNSELYDTYETIDLGESGAAFLARKIARWHKKRGVPCQDYCSAKLLKKGMVMVVADGVSSNELSHFGSQIACETVIETVEKYEDKYNDEGELSKIFNSTCFKKEICDRWFDKLFDKGIEVKSAATTLLFVIELENVYIAGSVGDGQILFFEDEYFTVHKIINKEDQTTDAISGNKCYIETFYTKAYSKKLYKNVLLSSDGMYDNFSDYDFWKYAIQIKKRFSENNAPLQPFCYESDGRMMDYASFKKDDDYSFVLRTSKKKAENELIKKALEIERCVLNVDEYDEVVRYEKALKESDESRIIGIVSREKNVIEEPINNTKLMDAIECQVINESYYSCYILDTDEKFLNQLYYDGIIKESSRNNPKVILSIYLQLKRAIKSLNSFGYTLADNADGLIVIDTKNKIKIFPEAIIRKADNDTEPDFLKYFNTMYGVISYGDIMRPLYVPGRKGYCLVNKWLGDSKFTNDEMAQVIRIDDKIYIKNVSEYDWKIVGEGNNIIHTGEELELNPEKDISFRRVIEGGYGNIGVYTIIKKERLM